MLILFVALVAGAAEYVRSRCRRQLLAGAAAERALLGTETAVPEGAAH